MMTEPADRRRAGFVAILGAPNVGKSTLVNRLVGAKVSIVSPKVQTTRSRVRGIRVVGAAQLVLVDTPGIFDGAKRRLERAMVHAAWSGAQDADAILLLVDALKGLDSNTRRIRDSFAKSGRKVLVAINKIDRVPHASLLPLAAALDDGASLMRIFMISALDGQGVDDLLNHLLGLLPEGPWLYPEDQLSDISERLLAAEITREKLFLQLHQELPYSLTVETESWRQLK
ncbi:MAG TPA: GTPase Era, partial [Alphaproteobacteria bacterium]|nr:GTPase Era [Alphaproteobacteria bacterium]